MKESDVLTMQKWDEMQSIKIITQANVNNKSKRWKVTATTHNACNTIMHAFGECLQIRGNENVSSSLYFSAPNLSFWGIIENKWILLLQNHKRLGVNIFTTNWQS